MNPASLNEIERRPLKHWNVDGLPEMLMGLIWLAWGGLWLLGELLSGVGERRTYWTIVPVTLILLSLAAKRMLHGVKARVTYPRVGYAEARTAGWRVAVAGLAFALLTVILVLSGHRAPWAGRALPLVVSLALAVVFVLLSFRLGVPYFRWLAVVPVATGAYAWWAGTGASAFRWMFLVLGAVCAVGGAVRFRRFLGENPVPPGTAE